MSEEVKVEKINIKVGDIEISLPLKEAKELQKLLNDLFGDKETIYVPVPYVIPSQPIPYPYYVPYPHYVPYPTYPTNPYPVWVVNTTWTGTSPSITCTYNSTS